MRASLIINNVDFTKYTEGIEHSYDLRCAKEITTLDGNLRKAFVKKRLIKWEGRILTDAELHTLRAALATNPASVIYTNDNQQTVTSSFWIEDDTSDAISINSSQTFFEGFSFTLREV